MRARLAQAGARLRIGLSRVQGCPVPHVIFPQLHGPFDFQGLDTDRTSS